MKSLDIPSLVAHNLDLQDTLWRQLSMKDRLKEDRRQLQALLKLAHANIAALSELIEAVDHAPVEPGHAGDLKDAMQQARWVLAELAANTGQPNELVGLLGRLSATCRQGVLSWLFPAVQAAVPEAERQALFLRIEAAYDSLMGDDFEDDLRTALSDSPRQLVEEARLFLSSVPSA
jgi:hypothetical protein